MVIRLETEVRDALRNERVDAVAGAGPSWVSAETSRVCASYLVAVGAVNRPGDYRLHGR